MVGFAGGFGSEGEAAGGGVFDDGGESEGLQEAQREADGGLGEAQAFGAFGGADGLGGVFEDVTQDKELRGVEAETAFDGAVPGFVLRSPTHSECRGGRGL